MQAFRSWPHNQMPGSLELAYVGDTIYDLFVRTQLVQKTGRMKQIHHDASKRVCAHAQSEALGRIESLLTPQEIDVVRRARNAHQNPPRSADPGEYRRATGIEALMGYLFLTGQTDRLNELMQRALEQEPKQPSKEDVAPCQP